MKRFFQATVFFVLFLGLSNAYSQFTFGVEPGIGLKNAYFGYRTNGNFMPYLAVQLLSVNVTNEDDYGTDKTKTTFIVPTIGTKYYLKANSKLSPFFNAFVAKPIAFGTDDYSSDEIKWSAFGGGLGFGTEYFFDPQFSVGGEFGVMFLAGKEDYSSDYDGHEITKYGISPTYAKISFNFYFKK